MVNGRIVAAAVVAAGVGVVALWNGVGERRPRGERQGRLVEAVSGSIEETVEATGAVGPQNRVEVKPPIGGRIEELLAEEGQGVKAGQIIAWMSSNDRAAILDAARAQGPSELKRWEDSYKRTPIVAPLAGTIILRNVEPGETVDSSKVLYALSDTLIVHGQVDESDIGRVKLGMPARVVLDAYQDRPLSGKVYKILYEGRNVSNVITYGVKVKLDAVPPFVRSQMTASLNFIVGRKDNAVLVPAAAIQDGRRVLVPGPDGKPAPREVKVGIESGDKIEILAGLAPGERVLLLRGRYMPQQVASSPLAFGSGQRQSGSGSSQRRQR